MEERTLSIIDNGIGMTKEEMEENLGTIARSGSLDFKKSIEENASDVEMCIRDSGETVAEALL